MATIAVYDVQDYERKEIQQALKGHTVKLIPEPLSKDNAVKNADIISGFIYSKFSKENLAQFANLKAISCRSTGFDHVDLEYCKQKNIAVYNVPFYGENTIAEHAFGLILSLTRKIHKSYARAKKNNFSLDGLTGFDLKGKTLGIVGGGHIGMHVARIAKGFGMKVLVFDIYEQHFLSEVLDFSYAPLKKLLKESDIVTLHAPYNKHTHHIINADNISLMKKGSIFINTARGGLVDTNALLKALKSGHIGMAGLDVLEGEEVLTNQKFRESDNKHFQKVYKRNLELCGLENVLFTPHNAFNSVEALHRILETSIKNMIGGIKGAKENRVN